MTDEKVEWWAGSDEIGRMGPYDSEIEAWRSLRLSDSVKRRLWSSRVHVPGAYVWPEKRRRRRTKK